MIFTLMLYSFSLSVFSTEELVYVFGSEKYVSFKRANGHIVSMHCADAGGCIALKMAKKKYKAPNSNGGKNPSSVKCTKGLRGMVVLGRDLEGNNQSFCKFSDGSYLMNL